MQKAIIDYHAGINAPDNIDLEDIHVYLKERGDSLIITDVKDNFDGGTKKLNSLEGQDESGF
jgi:hypothetical protein